MAETPKTPVKLLVVWGTSAFIGVWVARLSRHSEDTHSLRFDPDGTLSAETLIEILQKLAIILPVKLEFLKDDFKLQRAKFFESNTELYKETIRSYIQKQKASSSAQINGLLDSLGISLADFERSLQKHRNSSAVGQALDSIRKSQISNNGPKPPVSLTRIAYLGILSDYLERLEKLGSTGQQLSEGAIIELELSLYDSLWKRFGYTERDLLLAHQLYRSAETEAQAQKIQAAIDHLTCNR